MIRRTTTTAFELKALGVSMEISTTTVLGPDPKWAGLATPKTTVSLVSPFTTGGTGRMHLGTFEQVRELLAEIAKIVDDQDTHA